MIILQITSASLGLLQCAPALIYDITVDFSPRGGATDTIAKELNAAKSEIKVQAYSSTSAPIAEAIIKAHARRLNVSVARDRYMVATYLRYWRSGSSLNIEPPLTRPAPYVAIVAQLLCKIIVWMHHSIAIHLLDLG